MKHWIGRLDIRSGNITPLREVVSEEAAWDYIREFHVIQDNINKENSKLKQKKSEVKIDVPDYNKEIHGSIKQYIKLKKEAKENLPQEVKDLLAKEYLKNVIQNGTKLLYLAVHEYTGNK